MKWKINGFEDLDWLSLILFFVIAFIISFAAHVLIWWFITLLLGISFVWNHAVVFYIVCGSISGFTFSPSSK